MFHAFVLLCVLLVCVCYFKLLCVVLALFIAVVLLCLFSPFLCALYV